MKNTPKQYAEYLYQATKDKSSSQIKGIIDKFILTLRANNDFSKVSQIIEQFSQIWCQEEKVIAAEIVSARQLSSSIVKLLEKHLVELTKAKQIIVKTKLDSALLGGVVIRYGDRIVDRSLKTALVDLKNILIK